ncbi:ATPase [Rivularia sp. PCC 7116]|uniref:ATP-binding protein n=1 Tax=Rivularia sp. PCC 7116 TaxID=373994 RepID=UPI00029F158F|nr:ATP-binding protein [Rivularia sp. PCC 7116]AFY56692.1 ATPase [Rivularia sp. PCC 7116]
MGEKFVGRKEVMRQLEELWVMGEQLQSVVIYGHRRMGKTSILRNAANSVGSGVRVAYVNMLNAGNISEGVGEVLMAICDAVSEAVNIPPPDDDKLLKLPERTFERYLKQVVENLRETSLQGLIIAIDEFEIIEELIAAEKIPQNFLGYLRGLLQMNSQVAFAFAGLHTLEEMTADYFQPFFASVIPIHVGFMERAVTRQILANPVQFSDNNVETLNLTSPDVTSLEEDFLLDYKPEALDKIYEFTHGQPYLVQLIGFVLVRRYNDQVFELGRKRDPVFTVEDVEAVINNTEFFKRGRYYFEGVWSQAAQGADGQQAVLRVLAPHPEGLSYENLIGEVSQQGFDEAILQEALDTLKRHDVIEEMQQRKWRIIVELFRRWLLQQM